MAEALLGIVIENLGSFVREELATFSGVGQLIHNLSGNLTAIRAVLKDAEDKQITSHAVKDWLQKLTDAAHVLDDILDECSIESKLHGNNNCLTSLHPKNILARRNLGKRMKEIVERFNVIAEERNKFELRGGIMETHQEDHDEWRKTSSVITEPKVYGRDQDIEQVVEFLLRHCSDSEELSVYSIVGLGGLGKTTLAQVVFNDERVSNHFDLKIWVCVSDDFSLMKILQSIMESTTGQNPNLLSLESMQRKVQEVLQSKRYLLVLDDVWNEDQGKWDKFKYFLQCGNRAKGASILVTTRLETVASIVGTYPPHHLGGLSEDNIWLLFKQHAFGPNREERAELVAIGKEIVSKCVGSPLAAKALGSLLRFKSEEHQWLSVKESKIWDLPEDNPVMSALRLSYSNLKLSLRPCFSFCAIFPKDFEMVKEDLIHLWMANGFISSKGNLEVEHVGNEAWNELYQRSFFQEVKTDRKGNITFKMHDLVHDLAQLIMGEECVVSKCASLTNLSSRVHHIGLLDDQINQINYNIVPFKKVESLRTFLEFNSFGPNFSAFPPISSLRALRTNSFQLSALKNLTHLRYLELHENYITALPKSICLLQKLQILKLERCYFLTSLPQQLTQLQDLRHLVIKDCKSLVAMPSKIGKLTSLKTLSIYIVGSEAGFSLAELHDLQLGGKLHIRGLENVPNEWDAKEANLIGKKDINRLYLTWGANSQGSGTSSHERVLEALEPHSGLKGFGMNGYGGIQFAHWMRNTSTMKGLVDVILYDCKHCQQLPPFGKLPCLRTLFLSGMKDVIYIDDDIYDPMVEKAFASLKKLTLLGLPNLKRVLEAEGVEMLPLLSELTIEDVPKLVLPSLPSLEYLSTRGSNETNEGFLKGIECSMHRLKKLKIENFDKLKVLPDELGTLSALEELEIFFCDELESFPEHVIQSLRSLRTLMIFCCQKFKSLSEGMGHLTCLEVLQIGGCPQLVALPNNMNQLTNLRKVKFWGKSKDSRLPEGLERIPSLQILTVTEFPSLTSLPDWLGAITSLEQLEIRFCPELRSLPDSFQHLKNLHELSIVGCPKLETSCKKGTGKDWHKIAHVAEFYLDTEPTFCEKIISAWKMRKQMMNRHRYIYTSEDEFNSMVDVF